MSNIEELIEWCEKEIGKRYALPYDKAITAEEMRAFTEGGIQLSRIMEALRRLKRIDALAKEDAEEITGDLQNSGTFEDGLRRAAEIAKGDTTDCEHAEHHCGCIAGIYVAEAILKEIDK